jgi:hypothetical protein
MRTELDHMREALASYIEATYHLSNPKLVELRRRLLTEGGIAQTPFVESTPAYVGERKFASLALHETVRQFLTGLATKEAEHLLFDPPYEHQAQALEAAMAPKAGAPWRLQLRNATLANGMKLYLLHADGLCGGHNQGVA